MFDKFNREENSDKCLDVGKERRLNDNEAVSVIRDIIENGDIFKIKDFEKEKRNKILKQLKDEGLSLRQIERLTGILFGYNY